MPNAPDLSGYTDVADRDGPLLVPCEGSGGLSNYCQMCGNTFILAPPIPPHDRLDILAMLDRGDFG